VGHNGSSGLRQDPERKEHQTMFGIGITELIIFLVIGLLTVIPGVIGILV
jgi:hypothetical protein